MKYLNQFLKFDSSAFFARKILVANACTKWIANDTKAVLGTKVAVVVARDETEYKKKDGEDASNLYEKFNVKIPKSISVPIGAKVELVNPVGTIWGDYRNQLSVTADDIKILGVPTKAN